MIVLRDIVLIFATVIITTFAFFLKNHYSLSLVLFITWFLVFAIFCIFLYYTCYVFSKNFIKNTLENFESTFHSLVEITIDRRANPPTGQELKNLLSTPFRSFITIIILSAGSLFIIAILTNTILLSNLVISIEYKDKLIEQNNLFEKDINVSNETNLLDFANSLASLNQNISEFTKIHSFLNSLRFSIASNKFYLSHNFEHLVGFNNKIYYFGDIESIIQPSIFKTQIKTCSKPDEYCKQKHAELIPKDKGGQRKITNPYFASFISSIQTQLHENYLFHDIDLYERYNIKEPYKLYSTGQKIIDYSLMCGHEIPPDLVSKLRKYIEVNKTAQFFDVNSEKKSNIEKYIKPFAVSNKEQYLIEDTYIKQLDDYTIKNIELFSKFYYDLIQFAGLDAYYPDKTMRPDYLKNDDGSVKSLIELYLHNEQLLIENLDTLGKTCYSEIISHKNIKRSLKEKIQGLLKRETKDSL